MGTVLLLIIVGLFVMGSASMTASLIWDGVNTQTTYSPPKKPEQHLIITDEFDYLEEDDLILEPYLTEGE